ncbi:MAG: 4Fe-4S dicluster domain-containing protein [Actinomycetia bacterium]|nr:4Fe-4S dicluster domain-containing protein [Actinomycetes bacterium]
MADKNQTVDETAGKEISRRQFVTGLGGAGIGVILGGLIAKGFILPDEAVAFPVSQGYLVVDSKKCGECQTCMLMCSLAHDGVANPSLSRIQVEFDPYGKFPSEVAVNQCHQCVYPACVDACPTGANHVDTKHGNVRRIDPAKCIGCERCIQACPYTPSRVQWNFEKKHSQKCDLCVDTPYWNEKGGPGGKQACVESCPMNAISFVSVTPASTDYDTNLRTMGWAFLGMPVDDAGTQDPTVSGLQAAVSQK